MCHSKTHLKKIMNSHVPAGYFAYPKSDFTMPLEVWFRNYLKDNVLSELSLKNLKDIPGVILVVVRKMIHYHIRCIWNHYPMIWKLLVLKQWLTNNSQ